MILQQSSNIQVQIKTVSADLEIIIISFRMTTTNPTNILLAAGSEVMPQRGFVVAS
jgi:hypothetical protein